MRGRSRSIDFTLWATILWITISGARQCSADQEDLLSLARAGHRAARESIHSLSATVTVENTFPKQPKLTQTGRYWRSFDVVRIQENVGGGSEDYLLKNSEIRQVGQGAGPQPGQMHYGAARKATTEFLSRVDVWRAMMIDFGGPNGGCYDLDRFLDFAKEPPRANRERKDGRDCIRIDIRLVSNTGVENDITLWHDIARNYLVCKEMMVDKTSSYKSGGNISEFAEPLPGLFVPIKYHGEYFRGDELICMIDITLSDLQVNKPIPKSMFQLPAIPSGTELLDHIQGKRYPIDANWQPIGTSQPLVIQRFPGKSDNLGSEYHSQSTAEARSFSWWLVTGSLMVLVSACVYSIYRRFRSRAGLSQAD